MQLSESLVGGPGVIGGDVLLHLGDGFGTVVVEHLRHGSGHTASDAASEGEIHGALIVVGRALIPAGGAKGGHGGVRGDSQQGTLRVGDGVLLDILELRRLPTEPVLEVLRQLGIVELALAGVAQNGIDAVVSGGNDVALALATVEDVVEFVVRVGDAEAAAGCQFGTFLDGSQSSSRGTAGDVHPVSRQ